MVGYSWKRCEDFNVPSNSISCGNDDDGSIIYCGKTWYDGTEVPAKIIPDKRECRVICGETERTVPNCSKVLISRDETDNCCENFEIDYDECNQHRHHHHHHHHHDRRHHHHNDHHHHGNSCHQSNCCDEEETTTTTKTESNNKNECKTFIRSIKVSSSSNTTTVKKEKKERKKPICWTERRTRMVPKVTYEQKVRYEPKVHTEKTVRYVPETYTITVCDDKSCCKPCERKREVCKDECYTECSSTDSESNNECSPYRGEEIIIKPKRSPSPPCMVRSRCR